MSTFPERQNEANFFMEIVEGKEVPVKLQSNVISQNISIVSISNPATNVENIFLFSMSISKVCSGNLIKTTSIIKAVSFPEQSLYLL